MPRRASATVIAIAVALAAACSHDAKPAVAPDEHPPLPPASGTPIGYLVDDASELQLTDDQLTRLKAIDDELAARIAVLDGDLRAPRPAASGQSGRRRGGGMRGGGMRGGRRGGAGAGAGAGSGAPATGAGAGSGTGSAAGAQPAGNAGAASRITEQRADAVRTAIAQSLGLLDPVQKIVARRVLTEHGVDVDAGRPAAAAGEGDAEPDDEPGGPGEPGPGSDR